MSKSASETRVELNVLAPDEATEIFVMDSAFRRIAKGVGEVNEMVKPGLYKVRFRSGAEQRDKLIEVLDERTVVTTGPLDFFSAAPFNGASDLADRQRKVAEKQSLVETLDKGEGSAIFLFVRDVGVKLSKPPWGGVSLHDIDGRLIAEMGEGHCDQENQCAALNASLSPGTYRLRADTGGLGVYDMFIVASEGWQTQVFLHADDFFLGKRSFRSMALKSAAIFMTRSGVGFHPIRQHVRLTELARQGLAAGRNVVQKIDLELLLGARYENPMLGIYSAHLELMSRRPDHNMIDMVSENLRGMLRDHPDVMALSLLPGRRSDEEPPVFTTPPMLLSSWNLIVKSSLKRISTAPGGSAAEKLADGLMSSSPWLLYKESDLASRSAPEMSFARTRRVLEKMTQLGKEDSLAILQQAREKSTSFTPIEQKIITSTFGHELPDAHLLPEKGATAFSSKGVSVQQILRDVQAPSASIMRSTANLVEKLGLEEIGLKRGSGK